MAPVETMEERLATNLRRRREALGLRQQDVATLARAAGASWSQAKVAMVETGRRELGLGEALILSNLLGIGILELVLGSDPDPEKPVVVAGVAVSVGQLQAMLGSGPKITVRDLDSAELYVTTLADGHRRVLRRALKRFGLPVSEANVDRLDAMTHAPAERKMAELLDVPAPIVAAAAFSLWGHDIARERTRRRSAGGPTAHRRDDELRAELEELVRAAYRG
jgi:transcriptional regulator with XRE-family HTH domain